jgi:hypothetical protein
MSDCTSKNLFVDRRVVYGVGQGEENLWMTRGEFLSGTLKSRIKASRPAKFPNKHKGRRPDRGGRPDARLNQT